MLKFLCDYVAFSKFNIACKILLNVCYNYNLKLKKIVMKKNILGRYIKRIACKDDKRLWKLLQYRMNKMNSPTQLYL